MHVQLTFDLLGIAAWDLTGLHPSSPLQLKVNVLLVAAQREHACAPDQWQHCCILQEGKKMTLLNNSREGEHDIVGQLEYKRLAVCLSCLVPPMFWGFTTVFSSDSTMIVSYCCIESD